MRERIGRSETEKDGTEHCARCNTWWDANDEKPPCLTDDQIAEIYIAEMKRRLNMGVKNESTILG